MNLEEKFGIRFTFFFRTHYENGNYLDYEKEITSLMDGNWEIGLLDSDSNSIKNITCFKKKKPI